MVGAEDEDAGKLSTIPRSVAGAGGEAAAWELAVRLESGCWPLCLSFPFVQHRSSRGSVLWWWALHKCQMVATTGR